MILTSCSKKIYPDLPDNNENYPSIPDYLKTNSSFNLPISIPIKEFDNSISNNIPKKINFNNEIKCPETPLPKEEKCVVKGDITLSKFKLSGENNSLKSSVNIQGKVKLTIDYRIDFGFGTEGKQTDKNLHFKGDLSINSFPSIDKNWNFNPNLKGTVNFSKAYVHFGPKISVRGEAKKNLEPLFNKELKKIGTNFSSKNNLKKYIKPLWDDLKNPILLDSINNLWLIVNPSNIYTSDFKIKNDTINFGVGLDIENKIYLGKKPINNSHINEIPYLQKRKKSSDKISLRVPKLINYSHLSTLLNKHLSGEEITLDKKTKITLSDIKLIGDDKYIYIGFIFKAKRGWFLRAKGEMYFKALPIVIDNKIEFTGVDFDIKTKNVILNSAEWLFNKKIINSIENETKFDLNKDLNNAMSQINNSLSKLSNDFYKVNAKMTDISIQKIIPQKEGLIIHSSANGKINTTIKNIELDKK